MRFTTQKKEPADPDPEQKHSYSVEELNVLFGQYTFISETSTAHGHVYIAFDKPQAKLIKFQSFDLSPLKEDRQRFYRNHFKKAKKTDHPNLQGIIDFWIHEEYIFLGTEELDVSNLSQFITDKRCGFHEVLEITIQVAGVLEALHKHKMHYGAVTIEDIYVGKKNAVKLLPSMLTKLIYDLDTANVAVTANDAATANNTATAIAAIDIFATDDDVTTTSDPINTYASNASNTYKSVDNQSDRTADISALGRNLCFISTGYMPEEMKPTTWQRYGVDALLEPIIHQTIRSEDYKYYTNLEELIDLLIDIQTQSFSSHDIGYKCLQTRFLRQSVAQIWSHNPMESELSAEDEARGAAEAAIPAQGILFDKRYEVLKCIDTAGILTTFKAIDQTANKAPVLLPIFVLSKKEPNLREIRTITRQLRAFKHPNISPVMELKLMKHIAYAVYEEEPGETLANFAGRHTFTFQETIHFLKQITTAIHECNNQNIPYYSISVDNVIVYKGEDDNYIYRILDIAKVPIINLTAENYHPADYFDNPETIPPEVYEGIVSNFSTSQYMLSQVVYRMLNNSHPTEGFELQDALDYHRSSGKFKMVDYPTMPQPFIAWLNRISSPLIERRYNQAYDMYEAIQSLETLETPESETC